ncbi:MAG: tetratricopeptide repeat protein [Byssovorax sp.]
MSQLHQRIQHLALFAALFLLACTAPPRPACAPAAVRGKPVLCAPASSGELFVVGLPAQHGWERGDWVLLDVARKGFDRAVPVAMAVVVERYDDLARVAVLYQREAVSLDGASARKISKEDRARLGKFVGRVVGVDLARVKLDVGAQDKVVEGDVYQVLSSRDHQAIGRVRVTEVGDLWAYGVVLGVREEQLREGLDAVFLKNAVQDEAQPVSILVVSFDPHDDKDKEESKAGRGLAKDLADALGKASAGAKDVVVRFEGDERVRLGAGDLAGEKEARLIGKRFGVDIVVWGSARCSEMACLQPRFTVVDPGRMMEHGYKGAEIWVEKDKGGFAFKGDAPGDPLALAAGILGSMAFDAQRYADASYYLGQAVGKNVLRGADEFLDRKRLAYAMYVRGQTAGAREQALALIQRARTANDEGWAQQGHEELARINILEGKVKEARAELEAIRLWSTISRDDWELAYALGTLADLEMRQGQLDEARKLYRQSLDLERRVGDLRGEAAIIHDLAAVEALHGRVDEARKLYTQSLDLKRRIGDILGEAATLHQLAILEEQQGRWGEARKLYIQSLDLKRRFGDVEGEAATLHQLARLEEQEGRLDEARKLYTQSLDLEHRIGDVQGDIITSESLAVLDYKQGKKGAAVRALERCLDKARAIKHIEYEALILSNLAGIDRDRGNFDRARNRWNEALTLYRQLQMPAEIERAERHIADLAIFESIYAAWKAYPDLLVNGGIVIIKIRSDSEAEKVDLHPGDILLRYDRIRLDKADDLPPLAKATDSAKIVTLELLRGADKLTVQAHGGPLDVDTITIKADPPASKP